MRNQYWLLKKLWWLWSTKFITKVNLFQQSLYLKEKSKQFPINFRSSNSFFLFSKLKNMLKTYDSLDIISALLCSKFCFILKLANVDWFTFNILHHFHQTCLIHLICIYKTSFLEYENQECLYSCLGIFKFA